MTMRFEEWAEQVAHDFENVALKFGECVNIRSRMV